MKYIFIEPLMLEGINISFEYVYRMFKIKEELSGIETQNLKAYSISSGIRIKKEYYTQIDGVKIISPGDIKDSIIKVKSLKQVKGNVLKEKDFVYYGDILITAAGRSGQIVFVTKELDGLAITSDVIRIRTSNEVDGNKIFSFLKSELGQQQINSFKKGITNKILIEDIGRIKIPCEHKSYSKEMVSEPIQYSYDKNYKSAKILFDQYIDYNGVESVDNSFFISEYLIHAERWEPQFYSFYCSKLFKVLMKNTDKVKWEKLSDLVIIKKAVLPGISAEEWVKYITISDVDAEHSKIKSHQKDCYGNLSNRMRYIVIEGEVLTAKSGSTTGKVGHASAVVSKRYNGMVVSDAFYNLIPVNINPYYLLFLLKQPVVLGQIDVLAKGSLYRTVQRVDFENIKIPRLFKEDETTISKLMKDAVCE